MPSDLPMPDFWITYFLPLTLTLLTLALLCVWWVVPYLRRQNPVTALTILMVVGVFRNVDFGPLHGTVLPEFPDAVRWILAGGALAAVLLSLLALGLLRWRSKHAVRVVWLYLIVNVAYSLATFAYGFDSQAPHLGGHWYIATFYLPVVVVQLVLLFLFLRRDRQQLAANLTA